MTLTEILLLMLLLLLIANIFISISKKNGVNTDGLESALTRANIDISKIDPLIRSEFSNNREEIQKSSRGNREELGNAIKTFTEQFSTNSKDNRTELTNSLKSFEEKFTLGIKDFNEFQRTKFNDLLLKQEQLKADTETKFDKIRETVEQKLKTLQEENSKKLEEMRVTVDEKLQSTLEKRFNDSFTLISERLELVHKGLGEMQTLAVSVGDFKKVMTNVKSRGILGEYQLANLLEDLLTKEQYEKNVKTKADSGEVVEFAIKMPNNNSLDKTLWLPIDSKFPKEDYDALVDAYDEADPIKLDILRKAFKNAIIKSARDIRTKYIDPPNTTDIGIMFLPSESLYAEVLRTPGLFELLQKDYRITITGPTTLSALLSSLQMGFRTLEIQKRSSEVWDILSVVKKEFGKFGDTLEKTKRQLEAATKTIGDAGVRTRAIERQLKNVQETPSLETTTRIEKEINAESLDLEHNLNTVFLNNESPD